MQDNWRLVALLCAIFPLLAIILVSTLMPESPSWLREHGRLEEAEKILRKFRGVPDECPLPAELQAELRPKFQPTKKRQDLLDNIFTKKALKPFGIMLSFFFFQQFSGIFAVVYYAVDMTKDAGLTIDGYVGAILIGLTRLVGTLLVASISKKFGRRLPSIVSGTGMTLFMAILAAYLFFKSRSEGIHDGGVIPASCILMYIFMSTMGFLVLPFAMVGEIYPATVKDVLSGLTTCIAYIFSFVTVKTYTGMIVTMGKPGVFLFYAVMSLLGTIFVIALLPETRGKSLAEIEEFFGKKKKAILVVTNGTVEQDSLEKETMIPLKSVTNDS